MADYAILLLLLNLTLQSLVWGKQFINQSTKQKDSKSHNNINEHSLYEKLRKLLEVLNKMDTENL